MLSYIPSEFDSHIERGGRGAKKIEAAPILFLCLVFAVLCLPSTVRNMIFPSKQGEEMSFDVFT